MAAFHGVLRVVANHQILTCHISLEDCCCETIDFLQQPLWEMPTKSVAIDYHLVLFTDMTYCPVGPPYNICPKDCLATTF